MRKRVAALICAAGSSTRMGGIKKEYRQLQKKDGRSLTVLGAAVSVFASCPEISCIIISVPPDAENGEAAARMAIPAEYLGQNAQTRIIFVPGGARRRQSVHNALRFLASFGTDLVLIHDGARPWLDLDLIQRVIRSAIENGAAIPVMPLVETPKELNASGMIIRHPSRASLCTAQTPQAFWFPEILKAHDQAAREEELTGREFTDDAEVWGAYCGSVATVPGSILNKKITFPEDLP